MNKKFFLSLLTLLAAGLILVTPGCRKSSFKISFELPADVWGNYKISYYAFDKGEGGLWMTLTAPLEQGRFSMEGISARPTLVTISNGATQQIEIYVAPGDKIILSGKEANPMTWSVSGNEVSEKLMEYYSSPDSGKLPQPYGDPEMLRKREEERASAIENFVRKNPGSPASAILLLTQYPRGLDERQFVGLWNSLGKEAERSAIAEMAGSADLEGNSVYRLREDGTIDYLVDKIRMRSLALFRIDGGSDTLRFNKGIPSYLFFNDRDGAGAGNAIMDSLRRLSRQFTDSASRNLALLSFYPDSIVWANRMTSDSLKRVSLGWMPLGTADKRASALGVPGTPWVIVVSGDGRILYRGTDAAESTRIFRERMSR